MNKEQWDYVGNFRVGDSHILAKNPNYARFVNPFTKEIKDILIEYKAKA